MKLIAIGVSLFVAAVASAQTINIKGTVTDSNGNPVIAASVMVKGRRSEGP